MSGDECASIPEHAFLFLGGSQEGSKVLRGFRLDFKSGPPDRHLEGIDMGFVGADGLKVIYTDGSRLPGFVWRTGTDTEVLLELFEAHGPRALDWLANPPTGTARVSARRHFWN